MDIEDMINEELKATIPETLRKARYEEISRLVEKLMLECVTFGDICHEKVLNHEDHVERLLKQADKVGTVRKNLEFKISRYLH